MPNAFEANAQTVLLLAAVACALLILALLVVRARRGRAMAGEDGLRRELGEIGRRVAALEQGMAQVADALPRSVGVGVLRYNPFPDMGGNMSFSVALLDGRANGVVISVLNDRNGSRVYGKPVERGACASPLSDEEQQALALARGSRR